MKNKTSVPVKTISINQIYQYQSAKKELLEEAGLKDVIGTLMERGSPPMRLKRFRGGRFAFRDYQVLRRIYQVYHQFS